MDPLRLVLQRLPIDRIVELARHGEILDWRFVRERAKNVDRIDVTSLTDVLRNRGVRPDRACMAISLSHGELRNRRKVTLNQDERALYRAAFIGNYDVYKNSQARDMCPNISLRSSSAEIRLLAAHRFRNFPEIDQIVDPASIKWDPDMKSIVLANLLSHPPHIVGGILVSVLIGYLTYPSTAKNENVNPFAFIEGYITAAMEGSRDRFANWPELESFIKKAMYPITAGYEDIPVMMGYFGQSKDLHTVATVAIGSIWPEFLKKGLEADYAYFADIAGSIRRESILYGYANVDKVNRAREMLAIEDDYPGLFNELFRSYLRILLGLSIDLSILTGPDGQFLLGRMVNVAHPQLRRDIMGIAPPEYVSRSTVLYDLVNYFRVFIGDIPRRDTVDWYKLQVLIASGQAIEIRDTPLFRKLYIGE